MLDTKISLGGHVGCSCMPDDSHPIGINGIVFLTYIFTNNKQQNVGTYINNTEPSLKLAARP